MPFVIDASIAGAWLLPDETNALAEYALMRMVDEDALAPDLLRHEIRSILLTAERRGRVAGDFLLSALSRFGELPLKFSPGGSDVEIVRLARLHRLSAYDAAYLALALLESIPLVTLDRRLAAAAAAERVEVMEASSDAL